MQCLRNKFAQLETVCSDINAVALCICEHWLASDEIFLYIPNGYCLGSAYCRSVYKNGGTSIFIRDGLLFEVINTHNYCSEKTCEVCAVRLIDSDIVLVSLYRSPHGEVEEFFEKFELLLQDISRFNCKIIIGTDLNIDLTKHSNEAKLFLNILRSFNLFVTSFLPTRAGACLDYFLTNCLTENYAVQPIDFCISDHLTLIMSISHLCAAAHDVSRDPIFVRRFGDLNLQILINYLQSVDWNQILTAADDVNESFLSFIRYLTDLIDFFLPLTQVRCKDIYIHWYTEELKIMRNRVLCLHAIYKNTMSDVDKRHYTLANQAYKRKVTEAKTTAYDNYITSANNKCKSAWQLVKREGKHIQSRSSVDIDVDEFNDYCISSVDNIISSIKSDPVKAMEYCAKAPKPDNTFEWKILTPDDVYIATMELSNSKSLDIYGISNFLVKQIIVPILIPLTLLFNACVRSCEFPECLKISKVTPIYKRGDRKLSDSYRPISLVPVFSKIFEVLIYKQLREFLYCVIYPKQFGFCQGRSTIQAVEYVVKHIMATFERKEYCALTLCDLTKAFDCVSHALLLTKLHYYGINNDILSLIQSYLSNRKQLVAVKNKYSNIHLVKHGVPQGSILGPFLFVISINDFAYNIPLDSVLYADDTTLVSSSCKLNSLIENESLGFSVAEEWFSHNSLMLNETKSLKYIFGLNNFVTNQSENINLLGLHLDSKLTWKSHIDTVCVRLSRVLYVLRKLKSCLSLAILRNVYFALFQCHITYGLHLWGHSTDVSNILIYQKKAIRIMLGKSSRESCRPLFVQLRFMTVINLYIFHTLMYIKVNLNDYVSREDIHNFNTRHRHDIDMPRCRLRKTLNSFHINGIRMLNKLPLASRDLPLQTYRSKVYHWLLCRPFYDISEFMATDIVDL